MPGARPIPGKASTTTAVLPRNNSVWPRCGGSVAFADLIRFLGRRMGPATPGRHVQHAKHGAGIRSQAAEQESKPDCRYPCSQRLDECQDTAPDLLRQCQDNYCFSNKAKRRSRRSRRVSMSSSRNAIRSTCSVSFDARCQLHAMDDQAIMLRPPDISAIIIARYLKATTSSATSKNQRPNAPLPNVNEPMNTIR